MRINFKGSSEKKNERKNNNKNRLPYDNNIILQTRARRTHGEGVVRRPEVAFAGVARAVVALAPDGRFARILTAPFPGGGGGGQCDSETLRDATVRHRRCR